ncbi:MAG: hypothetical protein KDD11_16580 [Acidobacteria bacterium]|nr:hypothetical protein [Acidobacteriota bacterium]
MKHLARLLVAGLFFATVSMAGAATPESSPAVAPPAPAAPAADSLEATPLVSVASSCQADGQSLIATGTPDAAPLAGPGQTCGSCSTGGCAGATRGRACYLGSGYGWGNCNIYSGGYLCPTGGWECQCGQGPLP